MVVGGGHAGVEAAHAAARMGARTACVVLDPASLGRMSCNPAIGGLAKGQLVREVDALGGLMGLCTDEAGIQFRMLNTRKGPAVRSPRAQCDREAYNRAVVARVHAQPGMTVIAGEAVDFVGSNGRVTGVRLADGGELSAPAVVLTTGTFLGGVLFAGQWEEGGGRLGEAGTTRLSEALRRFGLRLGRHKTGTPPRLVRSTIDLDRLEPQYGDDPPVPFSFRTERLDLTQELCYLTRTNAETHRIIAAHAHESPMAQGRIQGVGPRYCPSVEDKMIRFADQDSHLIFLEPEGRGHDEVYPQGLSTSLPFDVQLEFLRTIEGLEEVEVARPGYAVEYDHLATDQLRGDLGVGQVRGLYAAGQINGTSGYEEAAGQGIVAGINAARFARGEEPFVLDRATAYLGVMVDDLCRVNPEEPYRMFTSRAEYRLLLRSDNADRRLSPLAVELGLLDETQGQRVATKEERIRTAVQILDSHRHEDGAPLSTWLRRPGTQLDDLLGCAPALAELALHPDERSEVEAEVRYAGYIERQRMEVERMRRMEHQKIPRTYDYQRLTGLSHEARSVLETRRPLTLGEASRIPGVRPADLHLLLTSLRKSAVVR